MWWLYFLLLFLSILFPFLLSFDRKLQFYRRWKFLLPAIFTVSLGYILFDILFAQQGIWGFNPVYHSGIMAVNLPLEEILFFIFIPYASIFLHETLVFYFPRLKTGKKFTPGLSILLILSGVILIILYPEKTYTVFTCSLLISSLITACFFYPEILSRFYLTFIAILVPFIAVNSVLTGSMIDGEVVWYNPEENLGIRLFTIPVEDFSYGFSLILFNLLLAEKLKMMFGKSTKKRT